MTCTLSSRVVNSALESVYAYGYNSLKGSDIRKADGESRKTKTTVEVQNRENTISKRRPVKAFKGAAARGVVLHEALRHQK